MANSDEFEGGSDEGNNEIPYNPGASWFDNIINFFISIFNSIQAMAQAVGDFFTGFANAITNIFKALFIPSDEQQQMYLAHQMDIKDTISQKVPFVSFFTTEVNNAFSNINNTDFLKITIPEFGFDFGSIHFTISEQRTVNVRDTYEPYRVMVRSLLTYVVYGMGAVYLVKYALNYGQTQSIHEFNKNGGGTAK